MTKQITGNSGSGTIDGPRKNKMESVEDCLELMEHLSCCGSVKCDVRGCLKMKKALVHARECKRKGQCSLCKQVIRICVLHARNCMATNCKVYFCGLIRMRLSHKQEASKNHDNRRVKKQAGESLKTGLCSVVQNVGSKPTKITNDGLQNHLIHLPRSFSVVHVGPANHGNLMPMRRSNSLNQGQLTPPEVIGSQLIQAIGTQNEPFSKDLASKYEKMDISKH